MDPMTQHVVYSDDVVADWRELCHNQGSEPFIVGPGADTSEGRFLSCCGTCHAPFLTGYNPETRTHIYYTSVEKLYQLSKVMSYRRSCVTYRNALVEQDDPLRCWHIGASLMELERKCGRLTPQEEEEWTSGNKALHTLGEAIKTRFTYNKQSRDVLATTGNKILIYQDSVHTGDPEMRGVDASIWRGRNRVGRMLMMARDKLLNCDRGLQPSIPLWRPASVQNAQDKAETEAKLMRDKHEKQERACKLLHPLDSLLAA